jgi:myo-inositol 2-dehydrogenase/D-chiro-inositol 1-dehydrogenase
MHAGTLGSLPGVDELLIADAVPEQARLVAAEVGGRAVGDVAELLAAGIDGLVVAAPTDAHADVVSRAVEAGVTVFCEKPLAAGVEQSVKLARWIAESGGRVQIGFQRRFDAGYAAVREAVVGGRLGRVHTLRGLTADPAPPPAAFIKNSGGIFRDCSVHDFDAIRWVTGREVVEVQAIGSDAGADFFREYGDVDTAAALLRLDDDAIALVSATRYNGAGYDVRLEAHGSLGSLAAGFDERLPLPSAERGVDWPAGPPYGGFMERFQHAYVAELAAFVQFATGGSQSDRGLGAGSGSGSRAESGKAEEGGTLGLGGDRRERGQARAIGPRAQPPVPGRSESPCSVEDSLEALYVAEACELSRREHRPVAVGEVRP